MAIPPKFDSNLPLIIVTRGSENSFLSKEDDDDEPREEEKDTLVQAIGPHLSRVMQLGTAKHVHAAEEEKTSRSSAPPTPSAPTLDPSSSKSTGLLHRRLL